MKALIIQLIDHSSPSLPAPQCPHVKSLHFSSHAHTSNHRTNHSACGYKQFAMLASFPGLLRSFALQFALTIIEAEEPLFQFHVLLSTQMDEEKQGRSGNEATVMSYAIIKFHAQILQGFAEALQHCTRPELSNFLIWKALSSEPSI